MNRLKDLREDYDLTQKFVAKKLDISQRWYSHYETGDNNVPINILIKLALLYNTSVDYIIGITNVTKPYPKIKITKKF